MLAMLFAAASMFRTDEPPEPVVRTVTGDGEVFVEWEIDRRKMWEDDVEPEAECNWQNGSTVYRSEFCSYFSLTRLSGSAAARATDRAVRCAAKFQTECVLAPEIGVALPAAFMPHSDGIGLRMVVAPRIVASNDERHIKISDPGMMLPRLVKMNHSVEVEFLEGGSRVPKLESMNGLDAYCVQLLRRSFTSDCWESLD